MTASRNLSMKGETVIPINSQPKVQLWTLGQQSAKAFCELVPVDYLETTLGPKFFLAHWEEVGQDKTWQPEANYDYYRALEAAGMLQITGLFVDNEPAGYFSTVVGPSLHYKGKILATSDMFYIQPEHRAHYATMLFRNAAEYAKLAGADKFYLAFKIYKDITPLLKRLKFSIVESVAVKKL